MLTRDYQEAARKAWDEHTAVVESIASFHRLLVWFTPKLGAEVNWEDWEETTFIEFNRNKEGEDSLLKHVNLIENKHNFCNFVLESSRSSSDVMYGYSFLKGIAGRFDLDIHYEKPE